MDRIKNAWRTPLLCLLLSAATLATYWPVLHNNFIRFDDRGYITDNPHVKSGLQWENVIWAFQSGENSNWHPLTWISHMLDVQLFGLSPRCHHLVNLLVHTANAVLLLLLLHHLTRSLWRSGFVAALFALHPLHVESVAWAAERKDVLSTFFFLLTLLAYATYVGPPQVSVPNSQPIKKVKAPRSALHTAVWYVLSLILFALGLMSKPMVVTLPCVLLLLDYWPLHRLEVSTVKRCLSTGRPLLLEKLPFFALSVASCVITYIVQDKGHAVSTAEGLPLEHRLINVVVAYIKYLGMMFWPRNLCVFYPHPGILGAAGERPEWQVIGAALLLVGICAYVLLQFKRQPWVAVGWFWYLGTLVPVIGLVQVGGQEVADRYTYIPLIGVFVALTWTVAALLCGNPDSPQAMNASNAALSAQEAILPRFAKLSSIGVCLLLLGTCAWLSRTQIGYWRDNYTLFKHALAVTRNNAPAEYYVGVGAEEQGNFDLAGDHFRAAIKADPSFSDAYYSLGVVLATKGKIDEAIEEYEAAIRSRPWHALSYNGLGAMYWRLGKLDEAVTNFAEALRLAPDLSEAHFNLGIVLSAQGNSAAAASHFAEVLRLRPGDTEAQGKLAQELAKQGNLSGAETQLRKFVSLSPSNAVTRVNLADVLRFEGKKEEAARQYEEALRLSPREAGVNRQLGQLLLDLGSPTNAMKHFAQALRLEPRSSEALTGLGRALAAQGRLEEAVAKLGEAASLCSTNAETRVALGSALMLTGKTNEAARAFAAALTLEPDMAQKAFQTGKKLTEQGQPIAALASLTTAVWLDPRNADAHECLGLLLARQGRIGEAAAQFEEVLRLHPDGQACYNLAMARLLQGRPKEAVTNYRQALKLKPDWPQVLNDLAWLLATCPQAQIRNGLEAVQLAQRACEITGGKEARLWGTLDAAYAEAGRFPEAISTAEKARDMASSAGDKDIADAAEQRLELYRKGQPYHQ